MFKAYRVNTLLSNVFCIFSLFCLDGPSIIHRLESLRTLSLSVFCFQRASRWGCTRVYGTQMIGQREAVWLKRIGPKLHSWLLTGTLNVMGVFMLTAGRLVARRDQPLIGTLNKWIRRAKLGSDGSRRIIWSTIIVRIVRGSLRESLGNVQQAHRLLLLMFLCFLSILCECSVTSFVTCVWFFWLYIVVQ